MAEMETLRCEPVLSHPLPRSRVSSQNGAIKLQRLMLEALISKRMSGMVKTHLENAVTKQLDEIVKIRFMEFMFSSDFMQLLEKKLCTYFAMFAAFRASPDKSNSPISLPLYQLQFRTTEFATLFSTKKLVGKSGHPIEVALVDESGNVVTEGKEASALLELLVLDVDLSEKVTTLEEFRKAEQSPRDEKNPLLKGSTKVKLENGIGKVDPDLCFTDNSSWASKKQFCLGLVPVSAELRIQGAKTRPFKVLDNRSGGNQKHVIPESTDEVWRLNSVRKGGTYHKKLQTIEIHTVGDFIKCLVSNPDELKKIFGKDHDFNAVVMHANKCRSGERDESMVNGTCDTGVSSYTNGKCFIREEEPIYQGAINQPMPFVGDHRSDLVDSSSILFNPSGTTCLAGPSEEAPNFLRSGRRQGYDLLQKNLSYQDRVLNEDQVQDTIPPLSGLEFADSNMPTDHSNMEVQGRIMIQSEFDTVRGQELQAEEGRNWQGHDGLGMLGQSGGYTSSIMQSSTYSPGLSESEEQPAHVVAVSSPSRSLKRRRDQNHDTVCRLMRPRRATYQSPSNQVVSLQELPCHQLLLIGAELPDLTKYNNLSPQDSNNLVNPYFNTIPVETPNGDFAGYPSPNMVHPSTNPDPILSNLFTTQANTGHSQIGYFTQDISMADLDSLEPPDVIIKYSYALRSNQGDDSSSTEASNNYPNMSLWTP